LSQIPDGAKVIIDGSKSLHIDHDVIEIIEEFRTNSHYRDIELELIDFESVEVKNQMKKVQKALINVNDDFFTKK
jgi:MFS superfamily sulfate permease-like transporter